MTELVSNVNQDFKWPAAPILAYGSISAAGNGTTIDCLGYGKITMIFASDTITDKASTFTLWESSDDSTYTAVADVKGTAAFVNADDDKVKQITGVLTKRYARYQNTVGAGSTGGNYLVTYFLHGANHKPVDSDGTT